MDAVSFAPRPTVALFGWLCLMTLTVGSGLLIACGDPGRARRIETTHRSLIGGVVDERDPAVGALVQPMGGAYELVCTATLIAPKTILSAAHCVVGIPAGTRLAFLMSSTLASGSNVVAVARAVPHPAYSDANPEATDKNDVSVMELMTVVADVRPIGLYSAPVTVGQTIRHVGFGSTTSAMVRNDGSGIKRAMVTQVRRVEDQIEVGGPGLGHCYGDSGGPGLVIPPNETEEKVEGIVSWGTDDCVAESWDTRVDGHLGFIQNTMGQWEAPVTTPPTDDPSVNSPPDEDEPKDDGGIKAPTNPPPSGKGPPSFDGSRRDPMEPVLDAPNDMPDSVDDRPVSGFDPDRGSLHGSAGCQTAGGPAACVEMGFLLALPLCAARIRRGRRL